MAEKDVVDAALAVLAEFNDRVDHAYGLYLDATVAMARWADFLREGQNKILEGIRDKPGSPKTVEELDKVPFSYATGDPNDPASLIQHESPQGELKARNGRGGTNEREMSRLLILTMYQFWEDHYRRIFAAKIGKEKNEIVSDYFGDIRLIRNAIVHHRNVATEEILKCKVLKLFRPGEEIYLNDAGVIRLIGDLRSALEEIGERYLGQKPQFAGRVGSSGHRRI